MTKILYFVNTSIIEYGIAKSLAEKKIHDAYAIIDIPERAKGFFTEQKIVKFQKIWDFQEHIKKFDKNIDHEYLEKFEKKYKIKLWKTILSDRLFHSPTYHKFTDLEILALIEKECKFFEQIFKEIKFDYLFLFGFSGHYPLLLCQLAEQFNVKICMLVPTRMGFKSALTSNYELFDDLEQEISNSDKFDEINVEEYFQKYKLTNQIKKFTNEFEKNTSKKNQLITSLNFLLFQNNKNYRKYFFNFGKTRKKLIEKKIKKKFTENKGKKFLQKKSIKKISNEKFVYFPLQMVPERVFELEAAFSPNQLEIIKLIIKSMPFGYRLYVKEHPFMYTSGNREKSFYEQISKLPNTFLLDHLMNQDEIIKKSALVITINGTSALEAAFFGKPSIVFAKTGFSHLPSVKKITSFEELPEIIEKSLSIKIDDFALKKFIKNFENQTFDLDIYGLTLITNQIFFQGGTTGNVKISYIKMKKYLEEYKKEFDELADQHIKKM